MTRSDPLRFRVLSTIALAALLLGAVALPAAAESIPGAPPRDEGDGPYDRLILRGATLVDGTGAPPIGPVDLVIEGNRIVDVVPIDLPRPRTLAMHNTPEFGRLTSRIRGHFNSSGAIDW